MQGQQEQIQDEIKLERLQKIADQLKETMDYEITNIKAGNGSFGDIMFANDGYHDFAVKIISIFDGVSSFSNKLLEEAKKEAKILSDNNHYHIVRYHSEFQIGNNYFIVMEKCEMSLSDWIEKNKDKSIDPKLFIKFGIEIMRAVQFLHSKNYVLRDLSLKNILLDKDLTVKLCDFGLAKKIDSSLVSQAFLSSKVNGALFYLPPEVINISQQGGAQKVEQNREADIWALGICLYSLAGAPFLHVMSFTHGFQEFKPQSSLGEKINEILKQLLDRDPVKRIKIQEALQSLLNLSKSIKINQSNQPNPQQQLIQKSDKELTDEGAKYYNQNMLEKAKLCFEQALQINPNNYFANNGLGSVLNDQRKFNDALYYYDQAIKINPNNLQAIINKGNLYFNQEKYDEAIKYFKQAISVDPKIEYSYNSLGSVYYNQKKYDEAMTQYKEAIQINKNYHQAHYNLGLIYENKNMLKEAENCYKKASEIKPDYEDYINSYKQIQKQIKQ